MTARLVDLEGLKLELVVTASPLPWSAVAVMVYAGNKVGDVVCEAEYRSDADLIVAAVNHLGPLVAELEEAREILRDVTAILGEIDPEVEPLRWRQLDRALKHRRWT